MTEKHLNGLRRLLPGWGFRRPIVLGDDGHHHTLEDASYDDCLGGAIKRALLGRGFFVQVYTFPDGQSQVAVGNPLSSAPPEIATDALSNELTALLEAVALYFEVQDA